MKNFMQQLALLVFSILSVSNASAQDGVLIDYSGTTRDASAILDLRSTNQGVLVPRVDIIDLSTAAPVTTPATGLLVYNSNVTSGVGYYYWNGLLWTRLIDGTGSNNVTGNGIQNYLTKWNNAAGTTIGNSRIFDNGTNVGIGNVLPDAPLTIGDGTNSAAYLNIRRSDNPHIQLFEGTTSAARIQGDIVSTHPQFQITTSNGATSLFNVNQDNGRVGIGTTAPNSLLDVTGSNAEVFINNNIGNAGIVGIRLTHGVVATQQKVGIFSEAVGTWGKGHLHFAVNIADDLTNTTVSDTKLTINGTTGYVGIGTPTPSSKLEVKATEGATGGIRLANSSGYGPLVNIYQVGADGHIDLYTGNNPTILRTHITSYGDTYFNAASTGNVGVGLTNPGAKLTIRVGSTDPGTYDNGKALFVSSVSNPGTNFDGNIEFRHDNLSQGIGFGYQSIYATGFNANQDLNIYARGTGNLTLNAYGSSTGYVGIGIAAPASQLSIASLRADGSGISSDGIKFQYDGTFSRAGIYSDGSAGYGGILKFATNAGVNSHTLTDRMTIIASGYVGIGTTAPKAPLEVAIISTASGTQTGSSYGYFGTNGSFGGGASGSWNNNLYSIIAAGRILCRGELNVLSDKRIKNIERISNATFDLEALNKIEVTDFKYKDEVEFGTEKKKGFIAQQLETVFPEAITQRTDFIPDVYALAKSVSYHSDNHRLTLLMDKPHGLTEGITLKIITDNSKEEVRVESIVSEKEFTVSGISSMDSKQVFVFGRQVDDLRVVDYDRIFTLNVSATQELTKVVRQLEDENERLKRSTSSLQSQLNSSVENYIVLKAEVEALKRTMTVYGKN